MLAIADQQRKWWILVAMAAGAGLIMLDETVVGVALPTIRHDLGMSDIGAHWVVNSYMLVFGGVAAAGGKLGDIVGFRRLFVAGAALFGVASLACGLADEGVLLIAARAVQGLGAAVIFPATLAMVLMVFPKEQRGQAIGILAAIGTAFLALGPLVGGAFTELVSWPWIFWINIPVVTLSVLIVLAAWVDPPRRATSDPIDRAGLLTLVAGLGMVVFAVMQSGVWGWTDAVVLGCLAGGVIALALFVVIERRHSAPLIDVDLFANTSFAACNLVIFVAQFSKITIVVIVALYLQDRLAMSPLHAGLALLVAVAAFPIMSAPVGRLADRYGARRLVLAGLSLATVAMAWLGLAAAWHSYLLLVPGLVSWGLGLSCCFAPALRAMANAVPQEKHGQISGISVTSRVLGGTIGMAVCSALLVASGSFQVVLLVTAAIMLAALIFGWFAIESEDGSAVHHHPAPA